MCVTLCAHAYPAPHPPLISPGCVVSATAQLPPPFSHPPPEKPGTLPAPPQKEEEESFSARATRGGTRCVRDSDHRRGGTWA
eukprot:3185229-Rhodomonas_salina.1